MYAREGSEGYGRKFQVRSEIYALRSMCPILMHSCTCKVGEGRLSKSSLALVCLEPHT